MDENTLHLILSIAAGIFVLCCCLGTFLLPKWYVLRIKRRTGWWLLMDSDELLEHFIDLCKKLNIEDRYLMTTHVEKDIAQRIIKKHQERCRSYYFIGESLASARLAFMPYNDFFVLYFLHGLRDGIGLHFFNLFEEFSPESDYCQKTVDYAAINRLKSHYEKVYLKLQYMALFYCSNSKYLCKKSEYYPDTVSCLLDDEEDPCRREERETKTAPESVKEKNNTKSSLRLPVISLSAVIGGIISVIFASCVNVEEHLILILATLIYYPVAFLVVAGAFRWKWKNDSAWVATLVNLPAWGALIGPLIADSLVFLEWYAIIGITLSVMIFEYKLLDQDN
jgi:hypothetical protein